MAYVIQTNAGEVRLFASRAAAEKWEALVEGRIVAGAFVSDSAHVQGKIPADGIHFGQEDQSTPQLIAAMWD